MRMTRWIPTALTISRMAAAVLLVWILVRADDISRGLSAILGITGYIYATDLMDGYLARLWSCNSPVGARLDLAADLLYVISQDGILICRGWMPRWVICLVVVEFFMFIFTAQTDTEPTVRLDPVGRTTAVYYYTMPLLYLLQAVRSTPPWIRAITDLLCLFLTLAAIGSRWYIVNSDAYVGEKERKKG